MRCARCDSALDQDAKVCGQCGAVVGASYGLPGAKPFAPRASTPAGGVRGEVAGLPSRVKGILRSPRQEWAAIEREPTTPAEIYTGYAMPLAAIGAVMLALSEIVIGVPVALVGYVKAGIAAGMLVFATSLAHVFVLSWLVDAMATKFGGTPDRLRALKLVAYAYTPIWLAGVLYLVPQVSILWGLAALYALFLAIVGLPALMRCPPARAVPYAVATGASAFALALFFGALVTAVVGLGPFD